MNPPSLGSKADLLIIDDNPENLRLLNAILSGEYRVRLAPNGGFGLAAARSLPPDLILLAIAMPDMNGYEVAAQLKYDPQTANIPIIFISSLADSEKKIQGYASGGVDYITRPFYESEILVRVRTHLSLIELHKKANFELEERKRLQEELLRQTEQLKVYSSNKEEIARLDILKQALQTEHQLLETIFNNPLLAILVIDAAMLCANTNDQTLSMFGYSREEIINHPALEIVQAENPVENLARLNQLFAREVSNYYLEQHLVKKDGSTFWGRLSVAAIQDGAQRVRGAVIFINDLSASKQLEGDLRRKNRALVTLGAGRQALINITDENDLLQEICRICVEAGGYRMAWIGYAERVRRKVVRPAAYHGYDAGFLAKANVTWGEDERGRGPTGAAIRTRRPVVIRDILNEDRFAPWRAAAVERGYASAVSLPLIINEEVLGALVIYSAEKDSFDAQEVKLLEELAGDLAYGIESLRTRVAREKAEDALKDSEAKLRAVYEGSRDAIIIAKNGSIIMVNPACVSIFGFRSRAEMLHLHVADVIAPENREMVARYNLLRERGEDAPPNYEALARRADGSKFWVDINASTFVMHGQTYTLSILRDNTSAKLFMESAYRNRRTTEALRDAAIAMTSTLDLEQVQNHILRSSLDIFENHGASLLLLDDAAAAVVGIKGIDQDYSITSFTAAEELPEPLAAYAPLQKIISGRRPLLLADISRRPDLYLPKQFDFLHLWVGAPVLIRGKVIALLLLYSTQPDTFFEDDVTLIETFCQQAASALINAQLHMEVQHAANYDLLTGVYSRRRFFEDAEKEIRRARRYNSELSFVLMDIDHFKNINDTYGHLAGDAALASLGELLRARLRSVDFVGRYGGEEFMVLLPETTLEGALTFATRFSQALAAQPTVWEDGLIHFTVSMGLVSARQCDGDFTAILKLADQLMYRAKQAGRNRIFTLRDCLDLMYPIAE